jgi:hypothetical protein
MNKPESQPQPAVTPRTRKVILFPKPLSSAPPPTEGQTGFDFQSAESHEETKVE